VAPPVVTPVPEIVGQVALPVVVSPMVVPLMVGTVKLPLAKVAERVVTALTELTSVMDQAPPKLTVGPLE
jgi:hypothetical protein